MAILGEKRLTLDCSVAPVTLTFTVELSILVCNIGGFQTLPTNGAAEAGLVPRLGKGRQFIVWHRKCTASRHKKQRSTALCGVERLKFICRSCGFHF